MVNVKDLMKQGLTATEAIQKALDTGESVYIPEGNYEITDSLYIRNAPWENNWYRVGPTIYGDGRGRTRIIVDNLPADKAAFVACGPYTEIKDLGIENTKARDRYDTNLIKRCIGIKFDGNEVYKGGHGSYVNVKDLYIAGLIVGIDVGENSWCNTLESVTISRCKSGIKAGSAANINNYIDCDVSACDIAFELKTSNINYNENGMWLINLQGCRMEYNKLRGVDIQGRGMVNIKDCYFERNFGEDIFTSWSNTSGKQQFLDKLNVDGCFFVSWSNDGFTPRSIYVGGCKHSSITNNYFWSYSGYVINGLKASEEGDKVMATISGNKYRDCNNKYDNPKYADINDASDKSTALRETHYDTIDIVCPSGSEKQLCFKDYNQNLKAFMFYHNGQNKMGCYDAQAARAIWRSELGSVYMDFNKHLRPETTGLNIGTPSNKWSKIYATTGVIQTSDVNQKEDIKPIDAYNVLKSSKDEDIDKLTSADFTEFVKNTNFITYEWKDKEVAPKGLETQVGFIAQDISKDKVGSLIATEKEYSMTNLVMSMGVALQDTLKKLEDTSKKLEDAFKEIEELKNR